jgi:hypothetical protein
MRLFLSLLPFIVACQTDTGFQNGTSDKVTDVGNGLLTVSSDYLNFEDVELTYAESLTFTVTSGGEEALEIYNARLVANPSAAFTFEERDDITLPVGESLNMTVAAYITAPGMYEGTLRIESNDATNPTFYVNTCVYSRGFAEPCPATAGGDDTGDTGGDDTGDTGANDTGDTGANDSGDSG